MRTLLAILVLSLPSVAWAQVSYPMVLDLNPLAVQTGTTSEVEINARYSFFGAYKVFVSGTGIDAELIMPEVKPTEAKPDPKMVAKADDKKTESTTKPTPSASKTDAKKSDDKKPAETKAVAVAVSERPAMPKIKLRVKVAKDAQIGVRDVRVATAQGVSTLGQLVVVRDPVQLEKNPNDALATGTPVTLPGTVCGLIEKAEDVDFFKFTIDKPTALTFHVRSSRLQDRIHDLQTHSDPLIALRNSSGTVLALSDNEFFADPLLHYAIKDPGDYYLEIRDVRYQGNANWQYSVEINSNPFVTNVFPLAVNADKATQVEAVGFGLPQDPRSSLVVPKSTGLGMKWVNLPLAGGAANPAPVFVTALPTVLETDDNHSADKGQLVTAPVCINGRIAKPDEADYFTIEAKKGDSFTFEMIARRHQSSLDPIIAILNDKGARVTENDDFAHGRRMTGDSCLENWVAPADGKYTIEVRDLHLGGGPAFVYALQVKKAEPKYELWLDSDKTVLAPGISATLYVKVARKVRFTGDIQLHVDGVPAGVTAACGKILDGQNDGVIIFTAAKDAKLLATDIQVRGTAKLDVDGKPIEFNVTAEPYQETYLPGGGRGLWEVDRHTLSVAAPLDILNVKLSKYDVVLKPGESVNIDVTVERAAGFDKNVTLDVMYRHLGGISGSSLPPGVTLDEKTSKTLLTGANTQGVITLTAAKDAKPIEGQLVPVIAHVAINFVMKMSYASEPIRVSIKP